MPAWLLITALAAGGTLRSVRLDYSLAEGAAACPDAATVRSDVAGRLGVDPFSEDANATLVVRVSPSGDGFRAELTLLEGTEPAGSRKLSGVRGDCTDLASALPFALSVAIEAFSAAHPAEPPPPPVPAPAPLPPPPAPAPPPPTPAVERASPWELVASASPGLSLGEAPAPAFSAALGIGAQRGLFAAGLEGRFLAPASLAVGAGQVQTSSFSVEAALCLHYRFAMGCALGGGGALWSSAFGLPEARGITTPVGSLGGRAQLSFQLTSFAAVAVRGEVRGALVRTALQVGTTEVWRTPPVSGALSLAVLLSWPVTDSGDGNK
jgi:hypothetical protein